LQVLSTLGNGTEITDDQIIAWANEKVAASGRPTRMRNFKDKSLANSMFYLELLNAIEPRSIEWGVVTPGVTEEDKILNAKYAISTARKLGAAVFLTFEDVIEVKSKMLVTFLAAIWMAELQRHPH
jgi:plastin-1